MSRRSAAVAALLVLLIVFGSRLPGTAGALCLWPALGVFPGMALATLLARRDPRSVRWLLGLTLSPVVASSAGWALLRGGVPIRTAAIGIAAAGAIAWWVLEATVARGEPDRDETPEPSAVKAIACALAALVALTCLINPFMLLESDGRIHAGITYEILVRGVPPQDPRVAGLPLNYVWFFNLYLALLSAIRGHDPFRFMLIVNAVNAALVVRMAGRIAQRLWRGTAAATGAALLLIVGLNAGTWVLWPVRLLGAFHGSVRGMAEVRRVVSSSGFGDARVIHALSAPYALMVSFLDKFLLGTGLNTAWALTLLYLWAMVEWFGAGRRSRLAWAAIAMSGLFLIHLVPGMAVAPVTLALLALAVLLRRRAPWLPSFGALAAFGLATLLGLAAVVPYALSVMLGWKPETSGLRIHYLRLSPLMPWTLVTACGVAFGFAARPLRHAADERRPERALLALWFVLMTLFASVVHLTEDNESKFVFLAFLPIAVFGGPAFLAWLRDGWTQRPWRTAALAFLGFAVPSLATFFGFMHDPRGATQEDMHPRPGERRLYGWLRDSTEARAVIADSRGRDLIMVQARRRLLYGADYGAERSAFPVREVNARRAVLGDLYGEGAALERDAAELSGKGGPGYVLIRPEAPESSAATRLDGRPDLFARAYDRDGFRVYRVRDRR